MQCIIMENTLIKLTLHDETEKRAETESEPHTGRCINYIK